MTRRVLAVQQVPHEGLGALEPALKASGCEVRRLLAPAHRGAWPGPSEFDGLVVMGGPQSVYEQAKHPFLREELALLKAAVKAGRPVLGICLGSQLLSAALGGRVTKNPSREIGWYPLMREPGADADPLCEPFGQTETVFQWHGDTFSLPAGAVRLFSSPLCAQQGFRYGPSAWGLQFHVEMTPPMIRAWLAKGAKEMRDHLIDPAAIRRQTPQHLGRLAELARHVAETFAGAIRPAPARRSSPGVRDARRQTAPAKR
jgi:GMP synthase (glutamine-hydrolysing)